MIGRYLHDIEIAVDAILSNKLKSALTALGIIFGVAAVISMLAIGNGAQQEILDQIEMVGVNNIVIKPTIDINGNGSADEETNGDIKQEKFSPGLTMKDVYAIKKILPSVKRVTPEIIVNSFVIQNGKRIPEAIGTPSAL
jgi:putative ABC transport system permease protein